MNVFRRLNLWIKGTTYGSTRAAHSKANAALTAGKINDMRSGLAQLLLCMVYVVGTSWLREQHWLSHWWPREWTVLPLSPSSLQSTVHCWTLHLLPPNCFGLLPTVTTLWRASAVNVAWHQFIINIRQYKSSTTLVCSCHGITISL